MDLLLVAVGVALILAGLADIFFTVLHYDGFGSISSRLYRGMFGTARLITRPLPRRHRALGLSLAAPLMVPVTITVWISLVALGYALVYYAGMSRGTFFFSSGRLEPSFLEALYFSGVSIATLGLGDVTPTSAAYQALSVSEALIGFGILTLSISYVLGIYEVLRHLGVVSAGLFHQSQDTSEPWNVLAPHFPNGEHRGLETHLMQLHRDLVDVYEGLRRYPIVYYYHSRRAYRSLPFAFRMMGGTAGALRWGLPKGHPGSQTPWLPTLITGLQTITAYVDERFLAHPLEDPPEPEPFETFDPAYAAHARGKEPADYWLGRFLQMDAYMRDIAKLEDAPDAKEAYARYREWLPFAFRNRAFFEATAKDLGYEVAELEGSPGERLF